MENVKIVALLKRYKKLGKYVYAVVYENGHIMYYFGLLNCPDNVVDFMDSHPGEELSATVRIYR